MNATPLTSGPPLERHRNGVGHRTVTTVDTSRGGRSLQVDIWYPSSGDAGSVPTEYELIPGVRFVSASAGENCAPAAGRHPLVVWSHGRTGMRHNYTLLCEALAGRGYVVLSPDHPGDGLFDWLAGQQVDDLTNENQRLGDVRHCIDGALGDTGDARTDGALSWLADAVDHRSVVVAGHSYGGLTALATVGSLHGTGPDPRVSAAIVAQGYTRTLPGSFFDSVSSPVLMMVGQRDLTTPPSTDAEPAWSAISSRSDDVGTLSRRHDLVDAGHQGCSDFGLYAELAPNVPGLPQIVIDYLGSIADESPDNWRESWRGNVRSHVEWIDRFLVALGHGPAADGGAPPR